MQTLVYTIVLTDKIVKPAFILRAENLGIEITGNWEFIPSVLAIKATKEQFNQIRTDSAIKSIELEQRASTCTVQNLADIQDHTDNWGLDRIDQTSPVLDSSYSYTRSASNVDAYVVDTGIKKDHEEFGGRVTFLYDSVQEPGLPDAEDGNGHGTHVAATLGGATYGVAKHVKIYAVKVLSSEGRGFTSHILNGLEAVHNHHNAKNTPTFTRPSVVNMSLSFATIVPVIDLAIEALIDVGIVVCVAAGNSTIAADTISPASVPGAITVGAIGTTGLEDYFAGFSNYGAAIDINAPGVDIVSAYSKRSLFTSVAHTSQTENRLGIIGTGQTVFEISITVGYDSSPFVKIGTASNPTLLLDAGPSGSNRPHIITQGRKSTFTLNVPFTTSEELIAIVDKQGASAGSLGIDINVSSKSANRRYNGTSMASPHVAGVTALRLQEETNGPSTSGEVAVIHDWVSNGSTSVISSLPANTTNKIVNTPYIIANNIEWLTSSGRLISVDEETYVNTTVSAEYV